MNAYDQSCCWDITGMVPGIEEVCVSTVQPEPWSCCAQILSDGNRLGRSGVGVVLVVLSFFKLSHASPEMGRGAIFGARCARF